jgi:hypothetical protein
MNRLNTRLERLGGYKQCSECGYPGPLPPDTKVKMNVHIVQVDENGRPLPPPPPEPNYCGGCGREMPVIRLSGLDEKSRGDEHPRV